MPYFCIHQRFLSCHSFFLVSNTDKIPLININIQKRFGITKPFLKLLYARLTLLENSPYYRCILIQYWLSFFYNPLTVFDLVSSVLIEIWQFSYHLLTVHQSMVVPIPSAFLQVLLFFL